MVSPAINATRAYADEKIICDALKDAYESGGAQRCAYLRLAGVPAHIYARLHDVIANAAPLPECQMFACSDGDVFILSPYISRKWADNLMLIMRETGGLYDDFCTLFDIRTDWPRLRHICEKKLHVLDQAHRQAQSRDALHRGQQNALKAIRDIGRDDITTLPGRRQARFRRRIMVSEDDPVARALVRTALAHEFDLVFSEGGSDTIPVYVDQAPDILFLDIGLPDIDGNHLLQVILVMDPTAFVVMFSGRSDEATIQTALDRGAKGFIAKPFTCQNLRFYINSGLMRA